VKIREVRQALLGHPQLLSPETNDGAEGTCKQRGHAPFF
jgi:hypothetical protein